MAKHLNNKIKIDKKMERGLLVLVSFLVVIFGMQGASAIYIGLTDGYVFNHTGGAVEGAFVEVTVSGCSGGYANGCKSNDTTESNGYYLADNLNLPKNGAVSVIAIKGSGSGSATGVANNYQVAHVNITVCYPPSAPTLIDIPDSHNTTVTLNWTSGIDPYGRTTYDILDLDGNETNPAVPTQRIVGMGPHTWKVKTCNEACCSQWATDTFSAINNAPSAPNNTNFTAYNDTGITSLTWDSGIDPDGDVTYDEFRYENGTIISPATSPFNVTSEILIEWEVRTCDSWGACSDWVEVDSVTCETVTCAECPPCEGGGGGGGGGGCLTETGAGIEKYAKVPIYCNGILIKEDSLLKLNLKLDGRNNKISIYGLKWAWEDLQYCPWCYNGIKDYDEIGVDCGGSCAECGLIEQPLKRKVIPITTIAIIFILCVVILTIIGRAIYKYLRLKKLINREETS